MKDLLAIAINPNLPGTNPITAGTGGPGGFVANFYQFALLIGGVLAFGAVVYGGVRYITAAGNPSGQNDAKEWITSALLGLLLLGGAYFILKVINPDLLNLNLPTISTVNIPTAPAETSSCGTCGGTCNGTCSNPHQGCVLRGSSYTCVDSV